VIKWPVKLYVRFLRFFSKSKKHDLLRFLELLHTFSRTLEVSVCHGLGAGKEYEWFDGVYLEGPVQIPFFADGTRQILQAHGYTGFFIQGATTPPTTGAQAQYHQTNEDDILEGDVQ